MNSTANGNRLRIDFATPHVEARNVRAEVARGELRSPTSFAEQRNVSRWVDWARTIELRHYVGPVAAISVCVGSIAVDVRFAFDVPDRRTGAPLRLVISESWSVCEFDARTANALFREALSRAHQHELDECLHVAAVRVFDPHRNETNKEGTAR